MSGTDALLRELNHRVNNNFQIVVSLMNLKKRVLPADRQDDIRFIEEHVQSMAAAYRLIYARGDRLEVSASDLIADVVAGLRVLAQVPPESLAVSVDLDSCMLDLDQAIALGLYLAVVLPPYLDHARIIHLPVAVIATLAEAGVSLRVTGEWELPIDVDALRERLMVAYVARLAAQQQVANHPAQHTLVFGVRQHEPGVAQA
jgi:hypothetical protein